MVPKTPIVSFWGYISSIKKIKRGKSTSIQWLIIYEKIQPYKLPIQGGGGEGGGGRLISLVLTWGQQ